MCARAAALTAQARYARDAGVTRRTFIKVVQAKPARCTAMHRNGAMTRARRWLTGC